MKIITYPINSKNPGSLIPIVLSIVWIKNIAFNIKVLIDPIGIPKRIPGFEVFGWIKNQDIELKYEKITQSQIDLTTIPRNVDLEEREGTWLLCPCGKVEIFDQAQIFDQNYSNLKLIDTENKCILCNGKVSKEKLKGVVVRFDKLHEEDITVNIKSIFPTTVHTEIINWIKRLITKPILITRKRDTGYYFEFDSTKYNLDPTIFNIIYTWEMTKNIEGAYIISGRDGILAYAIGRLLLGYDINHIFLPRFDISDWKSLIELKLYELAFLLIGSLSWKVNKVAPSLQDLPFIISNYEHLILKMNQMKINNIDDLLKFNRNFLSKN